MGHVLLARDTTIGHAVAMEIRPDAIASDPVRLARLEREAKTLASLNHPHVAAIYAVEKSAGTRGAAVSRRGWQMAGVNGRRRRAAMARRRQRPAVIGWARWVMPV